MHFYYIFLWLVRQTPDNMWLWVSSSFFSLFFPLWGFIFISFILHRSTKISSILPRINWKQKKYNLQWPFFTSLHSLVYRSMWFTIIKIQYNFTIEHDSLILLCEFWFFQIYIFFFFFFIFMFSTLFKIPPSLDPPSIYSINDF